LEVAAVLRKSGKPILLLANKIDGMETDAALADFASLGMGDPVGISAEHRNGIDELMETANEFLPVVPRRR
jgi:GTP-binding protein